LSTAEFYELTPRQVDALIRRFERAERKTEFLFGQLASCVVNFSMGHPKNPVQAKDFMPSEWGKVPVKPKRINRKAIADSVRNHLDMFIARNSNG
jgi:hypothetical protein